MPLRAFILVLSSVFAAFGAAWAQSGSDAVFTVPKVAVYAEGASGAEAQSKAQSRGRKRAMDLLLRRLTAEEDWGYLPRLAAGRPAPAAPAVIPALEDAAFDSGLFNEFALELEAVLPSKKAVILDPSRLTAMEEGFAVFDAKVSSTSYRAKITYRFKPASVRRLLQDAGLPYSEAQARRALVLPVLLTPNGQYLWESKNPWARAWLERPLDNELTPLILPIGDRQDIEAITVQQALSRNPQALAALARRYGVSQVLIAQCTLQEKDGEYRLLVRLVDGYLGGRQTAQSASAAAAAMTYDSEDGYGAPAVSGPQLGERGKVLAEAFFRGADNDFPILAQRAVETTVARYAKGWKVQTLVDHSSIRSVRLTAWFSNLSEWGTIQSALERTPLVQSLSTGAMNKENAVIDLKLIGDADQFILAMRQYNLTVWQSGDGVWNIADTARAQRLQVELEQVSLAPRTQMERERMNQPRYRDIEAELGLGDPSGSPVMLDAPIALEPLIAEDPFDESDETADDQQP